MRLQATQFPFDCRLFTPLCAGLLLLFFSGCAVHEKSNDVTKNISLVPENSVSDLSTSYAPVFILPKWQEVYNRIGKVVAEKHGTYEDISIDPDQPTIYIDQYTFSTQRATYINLVYRVHFQGTPFFHLTAGSNVGLLVVITLNEDHIPLLVTTAQSCGCYASIIPTAHLPVSAYPEGWTNGKQKVYGETLPAQLPGYTSDDALLVEIRPAVHRIMGLRIGEKKKLTQDSIAAGMMPLKSLKNLPLTDGTTTSFYYDSWPLRGHVKGSIKLWESLLLSLVSFDLYVGMDKEYGDTAISGNPFYTSLKIWNRKTSDMNDFAQFLNFYGWKL